MDNRLKCVVPKKLGFRLKPMQLVLLYEEQHQLRKRVIPLRRLTVTSDPQSKAEELRTRHSRYLEHVPVILVSKLVAIVQETLLGTPIPEAVKKIAAKYSIDTQSDLSRVNDLELMRQKQLMEITFLRNAVDKSDPNFIYDKQVTFKPNSLSVWDEDEESAE